MEAGEYFQSKWWYEEEENHGLFNLNGSGTSRLKDDVALITGCNTGIVRGISVETFRLGVGTVVIAPWSLKQAEKTATVMVADDVCKSGQFHGMEVDLADLHRVRKLALDFRSKYNRLNYFVENARGIRGNIRVLMVPKKELRLCMLETTLATSCCYSF